MKITLIFTLAGLLATSTSNADPFPFIPSSSKKQKAPQAPAADFKLIRELPAIRKNLLKKSRAKLDSGNTQLMVQGFEEYNAGLHQMLNSIRKTYFPETVLDAESMAIELAAFYQVERKKVRKNTGTIVQIEVPAAVAAELETIITERVREVTGESDFNYPQWEAKFK